MKKSLFALLAAVILSSAASPAAFAGGHGGGGEVRFVGMHPIAPEYGGGFCYIEFPHVHVYEPQRPDVLYRPYEGGNHFVGDPVPYGYEGPKHAYYGHHPIDVDFVLGDGDDDTEYCYIDGPHYHAFGPPPDAQFTLKSGVYFYSGDFPRAYVEARPRYSKINAVYRPLQYTRPVVVVAPPPEYHGPVYVEEPTVVVPARVGVGVGAGVVAGAGVQAGVGFHAGVSIGLPSVQVVAPAVIVAEPQPDVVYVRDRPQTVIVHDRPVQVIKVKGRGHHHGKGRFKWDD